MSAGLIVFYDGSGAFLFITLILSVVALWNQAIVVYLQNECGCVAWGAMHMRWVPDNGRKVHETNDLCNKRNNINKTLPLWES